VATRFSEAIGRKVISRASAESLGEVSHLVIVPTLRQVSSLVIGKGKRAAMVDWADLVSFGPDAVIVDDDSAVRAAMTDSTLDILGKLALGNNGNVLGPVSDVEFNEETGALQTIMVGEQAIPPSHLLGLGSYAAVLAVPAA